MSVADPPQIRVPPARRVPGRLYLTESEYWKFQAAAERPHEWKCGIGLWDGDEEVGEVLPKDGYDDDGNAAVPTYEHAKLVREWLVGLDDRLRSSGYEAVSEGLAVRAANGRKRYPDLVVLRTPPRFEPHPDGKRLVVLDPAVCVEVLSDSTEAEDLNAKLGDYASIPSVTDYVVVAQDEPLVLHYTRSPAADGWHVTRHARPEAAVVLAEPAVTLTLGEIYARVFPA